MKLRIPRERSTKKGEAAVADKERVEGMHLDAYPLIRYARVLQGVTPYRVIFT